MDVKQLAALLIEDATEAETGEKPPIDKKIAVYLNRVLLRHWNTPSFLSFLKDVAMFNKDDGSDKTVLQFSYNRLPEEALPVLTRLLAAPTEVKYVRFVDDGQAFTGAELEVTPDDFGGEEYDYAY